MNTDKKLEYFTEAIAREVASKKRSARQQMTNDFNAAVSKAAAQAETEAKEQLQAQRQAIQTVNNRRISEAETTARRSLAFLRERLIAQLFDHIKADIIAFTQSPAYENYLINGIKIAQAQSKLPYKYVQLTPDDMRLSQPIQAATGLTPEPTEASHIGGFKLLTESRGKIVECTIASRLTEARQQFATEL